MDTTKEMPITPRVGDVNTWFDSIHYQRLYGHRDHIEAANFIDALLHLLQPDAGSKLLDVACGIGRHSKYLASKGFRVTGFDLAADAIQTAKKSERAGLRFFEHDMRMPFGKNRFDYVFSFFTSFGYFASPAENFAVVRNMADSLSGRGTLVLDYLNVYNAEANLVPHEVKQIGSFAYQLTRWSDRNYIYKKIVVENTVGPREYVERVAKFTLKDFQLMFRHCGLKVSGIYGDYALNPYDIFDSPRLILIASRAEAHSQLAPNDHRVIDNPAAEELLVA
jgi:SAM-dependent methyltransferase